jgi:hypothetical protein
MAFEHHAKRAHRYNAIPAASLRRAKLPVRKRFGDFECAAHHVSTFPPESEGLPDSHPREHSEKYDRAAWFGQFREELAHLNR